MVCSPPESEGSQAETTGERVPDPLLELDSEAAAQAAKGPTQAELLAEAFDEMLDKQVRIQDALAGTCLEAVGSLQPMQATVVQVVSAHASS